MLYGMEVKTLGNPGETMDTEMLAAQLRQESEQQTLESSSRSLANRELVSKIHQHGLQPV